MRSYWEGKPQSVGRPEPSCLKARCLAALESGDIGDLGIPAFDNSAFAGEGAVGYSCHAEPCVDINPSGHLASKVSFGVQPENVQHTNKRYAIAPYVIKCLLVDPCPAEASTGTAYDFGCE